MSQAEAAQLNESERELRAMRRLVRAVQELSLARNLDMVTRIVRTVARELTGADGATFVLRDQDQCHYVDEDAIGPLWRGQHFPMSACVSGWAMRNRKPAVIPDIFDDPRVPVDAYRPTFVKSLVMVPIRAQDPIGAIGTYWARPYRPLNFEVDLLQSLANTTSVALESIRVYQELEQRVADRTRDLKAANEELEAFSYSASHDLRNPLTAIGGYASLAKAQLPTGTDQGIHECLDLVSAEVQRMCTLIDDLLRMAALNRAELRAVEVDLSSLAHEIVSRLRAAEPQRAVDIHIDPELRVRGDTGLLRAALENLISNAWKYSSKRDRATIRLSRVERVEGKDTFFVQDNGAGFDATYADQLFQPFKRLHSRDDFAGTGVGLATVRRIIERHGGRIWAEAERGKGATFFFTLADSL